MNIRRRQLIAAAALSLVPLSAAAQFGWDDEPAAGSCMVPDAIARVIRETCVLAREPYLILPRDPSNMLYALNTGGTSRTRAPLSSGGVIKWGTPRICAPAPNTQSAACGNSYSSQLVTERVLVCASEVC
jgi:hypothetical protein